MRFSIFEYSQEKLVSLGLDVSDALLLNWFANFFSGKMEKRIFKDSDGQSKIFGWIKISKVQEDLPVLGISTEKGIRRRFDNFVEKGLLERKTINSQSGKKSFYKTTDLYESLLNTQISKEKTEIKTDNLQRNSKTYAEENNIQIEEENPQRTKTTYAKNEIQNQNENSSQRNSTSYAQRNLKTYGQRNFNSYALNDSLTKNNLIKDTVALKTFEKEYFGENAFDSTFENKAADFLVENKIQNIKLYFEFIKSKVDEKLSSVNQLKNPRGFAYKLFFQQDIVQEFKNKEKELITQKEKLLLEEKRKIVCPVCEKRFLPDFIENCPSCNFEIIKFKNQNEIQFHKRFLNLSESNKKDYERKLRNIFQFDLQNYIHLTTEEKIEKEKNQDLQVKKLNEEFGLTG